MMVGDDDCLFGSGKMMYPNSSSKISVSENRESSGLRTREQPRREKSSTESDLEAQKVGAC